MIKNLIGPKGIVLICTLIIALWFRQGLIFGGAEEQLPYYNFTKSLDFYSTTWNPASTGAPTIFNLSRVPYFFVTDYFFRLGISNVLLEALTFWILILTGTLAVYYLISETIASEIKEEWRKLVPFLGGLFYFFNPFALTQIWGRALTYQFFSFALVPVFLLFFVLSLQRRKIFFSLFAVLISFVFSSAYSSPSVVLTSWASIFLYLAFIIFKERKSRKNIFFALYSFVILVFCWLSVHFFWLYPSLKYGQEFASVTFLSFDNILSLKGLAYESRPWNVIRLIHRGYYNGYGPFYYSFGFYFISWLLPFFALFSITVLKKTRHFLFFLALLSLSIFVSLGANFPTGFIFIWFLERLPLLAVLRNPYEKFGINLVLAFAPFAALGMLVLSEKLSGKKRALKISILLFFVFSQFILLVWPYWRGNFAGGIKTNFWVKVPDYYQEANNWLNQQPGDFYVLHLPLLPEDSITYTWDHFYEGIEPSEFLFDKSPIARGYEFNKDYYSALLDKFGANEDYTKLPYYSKNNKDFAEEDLISELAKLNVRYIILHYDTDYIFRKAISPEQTKKYLLSQNIKKVTEFGKLEIYKADIPENINLIYSPEAKVSYEKIGRNSYKADIENNSDVMNLYFLQIFHPSWQASIEGEIIPDHQKIFSYANGWIIKKKGNFQVTIRFSQQEGVHFSRGVSVTAVAILVLCIVYYFLKRRKFSF